ncbi:glycosyltransferase family 2 protein [Thioclava sp.]|uniref:glycosyltransferase family 2 protein n=1 Tax=Thioclava sp. TaxID=1933450 RepID=UPI003AA8BAF3
MSEQTKMAQHEDLAIVIPVWNIPKDLAFLLAQISRINIFSEVIVCDDASDIDCNPENLGFTSETLGAHLTYLWSPEQRGAGAARNVGLAAVKAKNVLFFDADDHLSENLPLIWQRHIRDKIPDFTIFRHADSRILDTERREASFVADERQWEIALGENDERLLDREQSAHLCTISAYPWNKIYRTDFLRSQKIYCSETPVHNDIRLHWLSFLKARSILAVRKIGAIHIVGERDRHLTTRRGEDRLCINEILEDLTNSIRRNQSDVIFMRHFIYFVDIICRWNLNHVDDDILDRFIELTMTAYLRFHPDEFRVFALWQPKKAEEIVKFLLREGV